MVRITGNFQQERELHPAAFSLLPELFAKGWHEPSKLNQQSRQSAILLQQAKETFASSLKVNVSEIEFLGETDLGFQLGIQGLLKQSSELFYSAIDRQKVFAVAKTEENLGRTIKELPVDNQGVIQVSKFSKDDVLVWQMANGETGNKQSAPKVECQIFADCTSSGVDLLPDFDYQTGLFDIHSNFTEILSYKFCLSQIKIKIIIILKILFIKYTN